MHPRQLTNLEAFSKFGAPSDPYENSYGKLNLPSEKYQTLRDNKNKRLIKEL